MTKNGEIVAFSKIMNPGERYRAKLALFLAMMRLGCEAGIGRHPGFLLLDQLGTAEMVPADLKASAAALRQTAAALAFVAPDDSVEAVERLEQAFEARRQHAFLAPSLLGSLTLLGLRNESAVRAEARQQVALVRLADVLLAETHEGLIASLTAAREAFRVAEGSEEVQPDATLFRLLLEAVLEFDQLERDREGALQRIHRLAAELRQMGGRASERLFQMDRSPAVSQMGRRCEIVASSIEAAAKEAANAGRWTNFDKSVVRLAECYGDIRYRPSAMPGYEQAGQAISGFADRVLKPRLGPILARKVGRESFAEVVSHYEQEGGIPDVLAGLRELQRAAREAERAGTYRLSEESVGALSAMAEKAGCTPDELISRFILKISTNGGDGLAVAAELLPPPPGKKGKKMPRPTLGIIVALPEELDAVRAMLANEERYKARGSGGAREYMMGNIPSVRKGIHQVVLAQTMDMGNTSAASRASKMLMDFDGLDHIIMCGIAGGVPHPKEPQEHVQLGDIVVSNRKGVIQYDFGKLGRPRPWMSGSFRFLVYSRGLERQAFSVNFDNEDVKRARASKPAKET